MRFKQISVPAPDSDRAPEAPQDVCQSDLAARFYQQLILIENRHVPRPLSMERPTVTIDIEHAFGSTLIVSQHTERGYRELHGAQ